MPLDEAEKRRRRAIDTDPANKCKWSGGCGNTARHNELFCGAHLEEAERQRSDDEEIASLHERIYELPEDNPAREILSDIVGRIEVLFSKLRSN